MGFRVLITILFGLICCSNNAYITPLAGEKKSYLERQKELQLDKDWIREALDVYSFFNYLGDLHNKTVLDLACEDGYFSKSFVKHGASKVVCIGFSKSLVEFARTRYKGLQNVSYYVDNGLSLQRKFGQFDVVVGENLFGYAKSLNELEKMFTTIYQSLKPGGYFVGTSPNILPGQQNTEVGYYRKYDFDINYQTPITEGSLIDCYTYNPDGSILHVKHYHYSYESYQKASKKAGFKQLEVLPMLVSPDITEVLGEKFWIAYRAKPNAVLIRLQK
ncbi:MAG: class I SAM-dependent methyltransferase [Cellvibrionales bacterium]|nr:class I SAM-dependent methyltransferase [Cellvibrionales bacterium]